MMKPKIKEVIVVEGRYDKNTLSQVVDATIVNVGGFGVFNDKEKLSLLRRLAQTRGLVIFTDPDGAGFVIRNHLKGALPKDRVKHAYVPDVYGKEKRKKAAKRASWVLRGCVLRYCWTRCAWQACASTVKKRCAAARLSPRRTCWTRGSSETAATLCVPHLSRSWTCRNI